MKIGGWETLQQRVKRHYQIPLKAKLEWMRQILEFNNKHELNLRLKIRQWSG